MARSLIPAYKEVTITIGANGVSTLNRVGDVLTFLTVSGGPFEMQIDEGEASDVRAGITYKMPEGETFRRVTFRDTAGAGGNLTVAVARGSILDARSVISGDTPVLNAAAPNDVLATELDAADAGLVALLSGIETALATIVADQADAVTKRSNLTTLAGCTYRAMNSATDSSETDIVSSGANDAGIRVALAAVATISNGIAYFAAGAGNIFVGTPDSNNDSYHVQVRDVFIPAGTALRVRANNADAKGFIWYEVL